MGESSSVRDKEKQQLGDLQCFSALQQRPAPEIKQTSFLKQECKIMARFFPEKVQPCLLLACVKAQKEQNQPFLPLWIQLFFYPQISVAASLGAKPFCSIFVKGLCPSPAVPLGSSRCKTCDRGAELCAVPTLDLQVLLNMHDIGSDGWHGRHKQSAC